MWSILATPESDGIGQRWEATRATGSAAGKAGDRLRLSPENNQKQPFWRERSDKSRGFGGSPPNSMCRVATSCFATCVLLELGGRKISQRRVQPFLIIDA